MNSIVTEKKCTKCGSIKSLEEFRKDKNRKDGFGSWCKVCKNKTRRESYKLNPKKQLDQCNQWYRNNKDVVFEHRLNKYGINLMIYTEMYNSQDGKCAICGKHQETLCIDHDHVTGKVRGLLCHPCNKGLGFLKDSLENFSSAIKYLIKSR